MSSLRCENERERERESVHVCMCACSLCCECNSLTGTSCADQITPLLIRPAEQWQNHQEPYSQHFIKNFSQLLCQFKWLIPYFPCFSDKEVSTIMPSARSPVLPSRSTKQGSPKEKNSSAVTGGLQQSVLAQKGQLVSQKGGILPSALPQNLLPLLGRGLSINHTPEHQSRGLPRRVKSPASTAASGQGSSPTQPIPTDAHSRMPHTERHTPEQEAEITTVSMRPDLDAEIESTSAGI